MWQCQKCQSDNPDAALFCQSCGEKKAVPGAARATAFPWRSATATQNRSNIPGMKNTPRRLDNYLKVNAMAGFINFCGTLLIVLAIIVSLSTFFIAVFTYGPQFLSGLLLAIGMLIAGLLLGLFLKSLGKIWQNSDDTVSMLRYVIDVQNDRQSVSGPRH
jgi:hypothetical protein